MRTVGEERRGDAVILDVRFTGGGTDVEAYLVRPPTDPPPDSERPGILWWHWLDGEAPDGDRTEFLGEAVAWAERGVASILPQGTFPWRVRPASAAADQAEVRAEVERFGTALEVLVEEGGASPRRLAVVGHDFGAMIAMLALADDERPRGLVSVAATPRWGDWMLEFWPIEDDRLDYLRALRPLDPIEVIGRLAPRPILLQHGERDYYIPAMAAVGLQRAAGGGAELRFYDGGHDLHLDAVRADRTAFLERVLEID